MMESKYSVVEYIADNKGGSCGYCKSSSSNYNLGMWAHTLSVEDYQELIDRGWRRSGQYCYKPSLTITCCPLYTIKCDALHLKLSKSQKKLLKRVSNYLNKRNTASNENMNDYESDGSSDAEPSGCNIYDKKVSKIIEEKSNEEIPTLEKVDATVDKGSIENWLADSSEDMPSPQSKDSVAQPSVTQENVESRLIMECNKDEAISDSGATQNSLLTEGPDLSLSKSSDKRCAKNPRPGLGMDKSKPVRKKAKLLRLENKQKKLEKQGLSLENIQKKSPTEKSLEDYIAESNNEESANKLELRTVRSNPRSKEFEETFEAEHALYQKYQMTIHKDTITKCCAYQFTRFLISSPLKPQKTGKGPSSGYGSFHQQYWLNGKLIAVGVIDILPKCVSSVYFFYDPDYSFLSLGTYGSLRELEFVRKLHKASPDIANYYMGYYIHTCTKMRYKARFNPSFLLCPEVYTWHPIDICQAKLDHSKYSRFNDDSDAICEDSNINLNKVLILWKQIALPYYSYKMRVSSVGVEDDEEVKQYAELVGRTCAERMLLYRS